MRCTCGQFVRMDRALAEQRSDPAPAPVLVSEPEAQDEDERTQLLDSLSPARASTRMSSSTEEGILKPAHRSAQPSLPGAQASAPVSDKPLWYVDLGGSETVEMTIEQLIIARRSGKLGEGALVWRAGMPRWRPVGTLIPASSASVAAPPLATPPPPPAPPPLATRPPAPPRRTRISAPATPSPASYDRPMATLEFVLENPLPKGSRVAPPPTPPKRLSEPPPRVPTPLPVAALAPQVSALTPVPPPLTPSSVATAPVTLPPSSASAYRVRERARWGTAGLALLLCVAASGAGALLVSSLRVRRPPLSRSSSSASVSQTASSGSRLKEASASARVAAEPAAGPRVVDVNSLSVERRPPRVLPRAPSAVSNQATAVTAGEHEGEEAVGEAPPTSITPPPAVNKSRNSDLPLAARANPYTTGTLDEAATR